MGRRIRNARSRPQANIGDKFVREILGTPPKRVVKKCAEPHSKRKSYQTYTDAVTVVNRLADYDAYNATTIEHCECGLYYLQLAAQ